MYVITGATGNTGGAIAEKLLAGGERVRVVGRDPGRLERFVRKGAEAFRADVLDAAAMARAFQGATAVYTMIPPNFNEPDARSYQERVSDALAAAVEKAGVRHVVNLSSVGAHLPEKTGPVLGLRSLEQKLNRIPGLNVLHLRPTHFMENILMTIGVIKSMGLVAGALRGDLPLPMIATRDIGAVAAEALRKRNFSGQRARELLGQRHVTWSEFAAVAGKAIGREKLAYFQAPYAQVQQALQQVGMSPDGAALIVGMWKSVNDGYMREQEARSPANTTPTSIEAFAAEVFAPRFMGRTAAGA